MLTVSVNRLRRIAARMGLDDLQIRIERLGCRRQDIVRVVEAALVAQEGRTALRRAVALPPSATMRLPVPLPGDFLRVAPPAPSLPGTRLSAPNPEPAFARPPSAARACPMPGPAPSYFRDYPSWGAFRDEAWLLTKLLEWGNWQALALDDLQTRLERLRCELSRTNDRLDALLIAFDEVPP